MTLKGLVKEATKLLGGRGEGREIGGEGILPFKMNLQSSKKYMRETTQEKPNYKTSMDRTTVKVEIQSTPEKDFKMIMCEIPKDIDSVIRSAKL